MRITLSSSALSNQLGTLSRVIDNKSATPMLECFLFEVAGGRLTITASDNENVMRSSLPLDSSDGEGRFAVNSQKLFNAVKELPEQPLTLDVDNATSSVKAIYQNGIYNFALFNANEYPVPAEFNDDVTTISVPAGALSDIIARTISAVGVMEDMRKAMGGINFDLTADALVMVASDGHKLVRNKYFGVTTETPSNFILPKKPAQLLKNALSKDDEPVEIRFNRRMVAFRFGDVLLQGPLIEGNYPNYNSVIPTNNPYQLTIDRKAFVGALRRILPFASESSMLVRLRIESGKLEISSEDIDYSLSAKEEIICDYNGNPMNIGFKGSSLIEILSNLTGENVILELADPSRPCIIMPSEQPADQDVLMLLMPMLLNDY